MIQLAFLIAFFVWFVHACTWEGMIFGRLNEVAFSWPVWIKKPLFDCTICMAPWWGSLILLSYGLIFGSWLNWLDWVIVVFAAGGINAIIVSLMPNGE